MEFDPSSHPHRRLNPLTNEFILVSPQRTKRPWRGQTEPAEATEHLMYDETCYLCPGNRRSGGDRNETYEHTLVFTNDFPALLPPPSPIHPSPSHPLLTSTPVEGACDVIVFHPRHDLTMARLHVRDIELIILKWTHIYQQRGREEGIKYVQIFENKGTMMGCSNPHPHGQVWSLSTVPTLPATEMASLLRYSRSSPLPSGAPSGPNGQPCMLCDYAHIEMSITRDHGRVVLSNANWVALIPWWAVWPFELLVLPFARHITCLTELTPHEISSFASILSQVTVKYDNLFSSSFAYSMGIHQRPVPRSPQAHSFNSCIEDDLDVAHLHVHFYPPLLRSSRIRKFLVGFELMAEPQRDLTPESAAERLRECSTVHYLENI